MWVLTQSGFLSVVAYDPGRAAPALPLPEGAGPEDMLLVRARVRPDLTAMLEAIELPGSPAVSTPEADYPYRAVVTRGEWTRFLSLETERLHYPNFKARVTEVQGRRRHDLYLRVWSILRGLGDETEAGRLPTGEA